MVGYQPNFQLNLEDLDDMRKTATAMLILTWLCQRTQIPKLRQMIQTSALIGQGWVNELMVGHYTRILENMHMMCQPLSNSVKCYGMVDTSLRDLMIKYL